MIRKVLAVSLIVMLAALVAVVALVNSQGISREKLLARCLESKPQWERYQEEIKGEIGARYVAEWTGEVVSVKRNKGEVLAVFQLDGPWVSYGIPLPVLMRDPFGNDYCSTTATYSGKECTYRFELAKDTADAPLPWVEVHYPHQEIRLPLDEEGQWKKP
ncbi:MAG TPA: hypothetical protein PLI09_13525 [Candidatus Hydrogenedentes bacterium]|nr:hypothetical protein [Candidatus Hydrogenedentota bacterium]